MRLTRILGLAVAAALLAMAGDVAVASAEVTVLCKANEEKCSKENTYELATELGAKLESGTTLSFKSSALEVECAFSGEMQLPFEEATAEALFGQLGQLHFANCKWSGKDCLSEIYPPWLAAFHSSPIEGGRKEWVVFSEGENGPPTIKIECAAGKGVFFKCLYAAETLEMGVQGGSPAKLLTKRASLARISGTEGECGNTLTWNATYVLSPEPLFVTKG